MGLELSQVNIWLVILAQLLTMTMSAYKPQKIIKQKTTHISFFRSLSFNALAPCLVWLSKYLTSYTSMLATSQKNKNKTTTSRENNAQVQTSSVRTARFVGDSHGCMSCTAVALLLRKWSLKQPYNLTNIVVFFVLTLAGSMVWTLCMIPFRRSPPPPKKLCFKKEKH